MRSPYIPSVLTPASPLSAISTERALKQIKSLLETLAGTDLADEEGIEDRINHSIDDVDTMLGCINRDD